MSVVKEKKLWPPLIFMLICLIGDAYLQQLRDRPGYFLGRRPARPFFLFDFARVDGGTPVVGGRRPGMLSAAVLWLNVRGRRRRYGVRKRVRATASSGPVHPDRFEFHAHVQTLVEPTSRTLLSRGDRDQTRRAV